MKKIFFFLLVICLTGAACKENEEKEQTIKPQEPCYCIMDTLKGEWSWVRTGSGWGGGPNDYTSIVKILSSNEDGSINYEVIVADTLFYKNSFRIQQSDNFWGYREINIKLPHSYFHKGNWPFRFEGSLENPDKEILVFSIPAYDAPSFYYQKTR